MPNLRDNKAFTRARVLRSIWMDPGVSRVEIASRLGLDKSTITLIMHDLEETGIISLIEEGEVTSRGGRRPLKLGINGEYGLVIGVEIQPDSLRYSGVNLNGRIKFSTEDRRKITAETLPLALQDAVNFAKEKAKELSTRLLGMGFGVSGLVDANRGIIQKSIPLGIELPFVIADYFSDLAIPIAVENDANCGAWGELAFHKDPNLSNFMFVLLEERKYRHDESIYGDVAVGMSFVLGGRLHEGWHQAAGEFRSVFWKKQNRSQFAILDDLLAKITIDPNIFKKFSSELASQIALLANTLDLSHVFVSPSPLLAKQELLDDIDKEIKKNWSYPDVPKRSVSFSSVQGDAISYGAAGMFLDRFFGPMPVENSWVHNEDTINGLFRN